MNPVLSEIVRTKKVTSPSGEVFDLNSEISLEEGQLLQRLISKYKPQKSLEIGLAYGVSSLFICEALVMQPQARHVIIDPYQTSDWKSIGLHHLRQSGYDHMIEFHEDVSWRVLARLFSEGRKFDFAFIDGCHNYDAVFIDFWFASRMMNAGGIIVLDDVKFPSVRKVCRYVLRHMPFRVIDAAGQPDPHRSWKWECLDMVKAIIPNLSQQIFKPEILRPDLEISRYFSCIALLKEADTWDYEKFCDF